MTFRVLTGQFMHETNTFAVKPTDVAAFERLFCYRGGEAIVEHLAGTNCETAGYMEAAEAHGWELTHTVACFATPSGLVTDEAFEELGGLILDGLRQGGPFDGIALALHGAMSTQSFEDGETELLRRIRAIAGPDVPICTTFDLHANVGPDFAGLCDIVCSYRTYPHIDMRLRARRAGDLLQQAMAGAVCPKLHFARRPMLHGADGGRTDTEPMISLLAKSDAIMAGDPGVLDISINAGFEHADVQDIGPSVIVTGDGAHDRFQAIAESLMDDIWASRGKVTNTYLTVGAAAEIARSHNWNGRPLVIADYADNPGAGAYGDATNLLGAMLEAGVRDACFGPLLDPEAAADMHDAGVGGRGTFTIGGQTDPRFGGGPLLVTGEIIATTDGNFVCDGPMWAGMKKSFGPSAVLRCGGIDILIGNRIIQITDLQQFLANGIDPRKKRTVALKSMQHFRAAYEPMADTVIVCDSGALASPDLSRLHFTRVRRPIHPLDPVVL
ncbi:MAG: M81 family metallopeptidase [Proteobacteria bacterium]|nr:M81 family metallopeptidase [Pseudomonadota bacterium]